MAHKRETAIWLQEDWLELLIWLDYCIKTGTNFENTAAKHLKAARGRDYDYTQIHNKLRHLWRRQSSKSSTHWTEIFKRGSSSLKDLGNNAERIKSWVQRLEVKIASLLQDQRQLRSHSSIADLEASVFIDIEAEMPAKSRPQIADSERMPNHAEKPSESLSRLANNKRAPSSPKVCAEA
jgi:hypothetical protein